MPLTNAGRNFIAQAIMNDSPSFFNNDNAHIGVGNSNSDAGAGEIALQTDLLGASKQRSGMEDSFPQRGTGGDVNKLTFKSTFNTAGSDFQWREWGIFNHASTEVMLNRKVEELGTKAGGTWVLTVTLTIGIGS